MSEPSAPTPSVAAAIDQASIYLVVPCYNEAARFREAPWLALLGDQPALRLVLVDDGSRDATAQLLMRLVAARPDRVELLQLPKNQGKAEAVRQGLLRALRDGARYAGYWDADLATPLDAVAQFVRVLDEQPRIDLVLGSRVRLLGRHIERRPLRHYLGRTFATLASCVLGLGVYDTQCGAKLFRAGPAMLRVLDEPFRARWVFDVELLARLAQATAREGRTDIETRLHELPLDTWTDVPGSKVRPRDFVRALFDLGRIYWYYRPFGRWRR